MYPSPHAVMYAHPGLADGSLTVLNAFSQAPSTMQVSHSQVQEQGESGAGLQKGDHLSLTHTQTRTHTHSHASLNSYAHTHTQTRCSHTYLYVYTHRCFHMHRTPTLTCTLDTFGHSPLAFTSETHPVNLCTYHHTSKIWKFLLSK